MGDGLIVFMLDNLIRLLEQERVVLDGVKDQVTSLQFLLRTINAFLLKNSEQERDENDVVEEVFVDQLRDVAIEAEDVVEKHIYVKKRNMNKFFRNPFHYHNHLHHVSQTIATINKKIQEILKNREAFVISKGALPAVHHRHHQMHSLDRSKSRIERDDAVGLSLHTNTLINRLLDHHRNPHLDVVSIMGMAGIGKTKLARKIYGEIIVGGGDDDDNSFECCAWVYGCREFKPRDWLLGILDCIVVSPRMRVEMKKMCFDELKATLIECLRGKKYIIFMDGMWKTGVWNTLRAAFPQDSNGSRILITCRERVVSMDDSTNPPYILPFLGEEESWKLLCNNVFQGGKCPDDELESIGKQLAQSCKGLPLSIVVLGDLLKDREISHWLWSEYVIGNVNSYLTEDATRCLDVMGESYKHLPAHLKSCFLSLGFFPEDFEISARQITELWSAEGFIQANGTREVVNVAQEYLMELVDRSLVQVTSRRTDGGVKTCCIHTMLRELSIFESAREKFLVVHPNKNIAATTSTSSGSCRARRVSIQGNTSQCVFFSYDDCNELPSAHSLHLFGQRNVFDTRNWNCIFRSFMYIRILNVWGVHVVSIPKGIEKLVYLKYLRIWSDAFLKIPCLPASLCKLGYFQTIDISGCIRDRLPKSVWGMQQLTHLRVCNGLKFPDPPRPPRRCPRDHDVFMPNLRVLSGLHVDEKAKFLLDQSNFPNVKKLHLVYDMTNKNMDADEMAQVLKSLGNMKKLKSLKLSGFTKFEHDPNLFPSTLQKITCVSSYLDFDHIRILGRLPNLRILKMRRTYGAAPAVLSCSDGEFPNLEVLEMVGLNISEWKLERGAMPKLRRLVVGECYEMNSLPDQLNRLPKLQLVEVSRMSGRFTRLLMQLNMDNLLRFKLLIDSTT